MLSWKQSLLISIRQNWVHPNRTMSLGLKTTQKTMKTILVIDDDDTFRSFICKLLRGNDFQVIEAESGFIGCQLAQKQQPDLILCELKTSQVNRNVLKRLRSELITAQVPIIFLDGSTNPVDREQALRIGANFYLTKPVSPKQLLKAIATQLNLLNPLQVVEEAHYFFA